MILTYEGYCVDIAPCSILTRNQWLWLFQSW